MGTGSVFYRKNMPENALRILETIGTFSIALKLF